MFILRHNELEIFLNYHFFAQSFSSCEKFQNLAQTLIPIARLRLNLIFLLVSYMISSWVKAFFPSPAGTMWRRRAAVMTWTKETTVGRSYTLMFSGFPRTKAFCVPCWEWEHNSLLSPQVNIYSAMHSNTAAHR